MNNTEQYLEKFKLKVLPEHLKETVIAHAEAHWYRQDADELPSGFIKAVKIVFYSAAAAVILMLTAAFFNMPEQIGEAKPDNNDLALLEDIGFSRETAIRIISLEKLKSRPANINLKTLNREI